MRDFLPCNTLISVSIVLAADVDAGTSAFARVVSSTDDKFDATAKFKKISKKNAELLRPVLAKAGITLDPSQPNEVQIGLPKGYGWAFQSDPKITISYNYN